MIFNRIWVVFDVLKVDVVMFELYFFEIVVLVYDFQVEFGLVFVNNRKIRESEELVYYVYWSCFFFRYLS